MNVGTAELHHGVSRHDDERRLDPRAGGRSARSATPEDAAQSSRVRSQLQRRCRLAIDLD
jgi:hypothetical protein